MGGFGLKALAVVLLLLVFLMGSSFEPCSARRRGKHWRTSRYSYFSSLTKKKGKWKGWSHHHYKKPKSSPPFLSHAPSPAPAPSPSHGFSHIPSPAPAPSTSRGFSHSSPPLPSHGFFHSPPPPSRGFSHSSPPLPSHGFFHSPPPPSHGFSHSSPPLPSHGFFHSPPQPSHGFFHGPSPAPKSSPAPSPATHFARENVFDVLAFGAKGNGFADDTKVSFLSLVFRFPLSSAFVGPFLSLNLHCQDPSDVSVSSSILDCWF